MSLLDLRRRIKSVKNTQKITKAMQLVAASKMKRAQDAAVRSRPYAEELSKLTHMLAALPMAREHPLLRTKEGGAVCSIVFTGDRGLCGSFNTNVIRTVLKTRSSGERMIAVGRKGAATLRKVSSGGLYGEFENLADTPRFLDTVGIARLAMDGFLKGEFSSVRLVYTKFVSTITQQVVTMPLLPVPSAEQLTTEPAYLCEPSDERVLETVLPRFIETQIWQALLESNASEQSARMVAMKNATDNAKGLAKDLTLVMNKTRQALITREISEIVAGVESMA